MKVLKSLFFTAILFLSMTAQASAVKFVLLPDSTLRINGGDPVPLSGSFELEYIGLINEDNFGGINDESFRIFNLAIESPSLTFTQVDSPYNGAINLFNADNEFTAGGFQVVTRTIGTIDSQTIDVEFQWGALDDESFIGNMLFDDGATIGEVGNDLIINYAAGGDGITVYDFTIYATSSPIPEITIQEILEFFDKSVEEGSLEGRGRTPALANLRLWIMRMLLEFVEYFVEQDMTQAACFILERAYKRTDGEPRPPDFVSGEATSELARMIQELRSILCESQ